MLPSNENPTACRGSINDYIVLIQKRNHRQTIARFVDVTAATETRPVVDVYFADAHQAFLWGRQGGFYAVNLSSSDSPFRGVL